MGTISKINLTEQAFEEVCKQAAEAFVPYGIPAEDVYLWEIITGIRKCINSEATSMINFDGEFLNAFRFNINLLVSGSPIESTFWHIVARYNPADTNTLELRS